MRSASVTEAEREFDVVDCLRCAFLRIHPAKEPNAAAVLIAADFWVESAIGRERDPQHLNRRISVER
jgi:hypothetical protein